MSWRQEARALATAPRPRTIAEFELQLRLSFGFSRKEAQVLVYEGWPGLERRVAPDDGREALKRALKAA